MPDVELNDASTGAQIVQHRGESMAADNAIMTLLYATYLEWTEFAKPVIFHEDLIVRVRLLCVLCFCLLTNDPLQSTRMVCPHNIGMCLLLLYILTSCSVRTSHSKCNFHWLGFYVATSPLNALLSHTHPR